MLKVTLLVKDGGGARSDVLRRLNDWFIEAPHDPPYPPGALLLYSIHETDLTGPLLTAREEPGAATTRP